MSDINIIKESDFIADRDYLRFMLDSIKIDYNDSALDNFIAYYHMILEGNKIHNLTAITKWKEVVVKHFIDSVLPYKHFLKAENIIDIGAGAGFPSIPIKIINKDIKLTLVDSLNKRVQFINKVCDNLKLNDVEIIHKRAEDMPNSYKNRYDIAVARAVAPLSTLVEYCMPYVKVGGKFLAYKANKAEQELDQALKAIEVMGGIIDNVYPYSIENQDIVRNIIVIKKVRATPLIYPRSGNAPRANPIE